MKSEIVLIYLIAVNILTFAVFGADKSRAVKHKFRIKEATLLGLSFIGGSLGGLSAMYFFRHKTQKPVFKFGVPLMLIVQAAVIIFLLFTDL